jgi:hypothetical protein
MTKPLRPLLISLAVGAAAVAAPAHAVTQSASVKGGTWSTTTVGISRTGAFTCGSNVICSGAPQVARFKVTGTNKMTVLITTPAVTLTNQSDPTQTLTMTVDSPGSVTMTSSGEPGINFDLGGSITLSSATADGTYSGTMNVTVDYQ